MSNMTLFCCVLGALGHVVGSTNHCRKWYMSNMTLFYCILGALGHIFGSIMPLPEMVHEDTAVKMRGYDLQKCMDQEPRAIGYGRKNAWATCPGRPQPHKPSLLLARALVMHSGPLLGDMPWKAPPPQTFTFTSARPSYAFWTPPGRHALEDPTSTNLHFY